MEKGAVETGGRGAPAAGGEGAGGQVFPANRPERPGRSEPRSPRGVVGARLLVPPGAPDSAPPGGASVVEGRGDPAADPAGPPSDRCRAQGLRAVGTPPPGCRRRATSNAFAPSFRPGAPSGRRVAGAVPPPCRPSPASRPAAPPLAPGRSGRGSRVPPTRPRSLGRAAAFSRPLPSPAGSPRRVLPAPRPGGLPGLLERCRRPSRPPTPFPALGPGPPGLG